MGEFAVVQERHAAWNWSLPLRRQREWDAHARFMDGLAAEGFILAGGPLGDEDKATRMLHIVRASSAEEIEKRLAQDPWRAMGMLRTASIEPWTVLLGGFPHSS